MSRKLFTEEQQQLLRQNPYIYSVTETRITLTKDFKEIFMTAYKAGKSRKGQILRPTPNTAPLICGACYNTQPEDLLTMA